MSQGHDPVAAAFAAEIRRIRVGSAASFNGLTLLPLFWTEPHRTGVVLADHKSRSELLEIREDPEGPQVDFVFVRNVADRPVLLCEGTIIEGAMQNRILHISVVLEPGREVKFPVSCVERGRWHPVSTKFLPKQTAPMTVRKKVQARRAKGDTWVLQRAVWNCVAFVSTKASVRSPTEDLAALIDAAKTRHRQRRDALTDWVQAQLDAQASGLIAFCHGSFLGLELFGEPEHWKSQAFRTVDALLIDWLVWPKSQGKGAGKRVDPDAVLAAVAHAARRRPEPIARDEELDVQGPNLTGNGVLYHGRLCHLSVFAAE